MQKKTTLILWICLALCLALMIPAFLIRFNNENNNKSVVMIGDYKEFFNAAANAHVDIMDVLQSLKESGIKTIAVKEITLDDLYRNGDVFVTTMGELLSSMQTSSPDKIGKIKESVGKYKTNSTSKIVITSDQSIASFLHERFESRFKSEDIVEFKIDEQWYFYINAETSDKSEIALGYNEDILKSMKDQGFDILLRPKKANGTDNLYIREYDRLVRDYNVKYIIFDGREVPGAPGNVDIIQDIIKENNIITGIIETPTQIKYIDQKGIDKLIYNTDYAINRVYSAYESYLLKLDRNEIFYQWLRAVVDRNIRFLYISPLKNPARTGLENINETTAAIGNFSSFISSKGYAVDRDIVKLSSSMPNRWQHLVATLSLLFGGLLYLQYLLNTRKGFAAALGILGIGVSIVINIIINADLSKLLALSAAILYPSLSSLVLLKFVREKTHKSLLRQIICSIGIILGINAIGMYTIVSSLSDIRYTMNVELYRGVVIAFTMPLVLFFVNYVASVVQKDDIKNRLVNFMNKKISYMTAVIAMCGLAAFYIYIARSGNNMGVSASALELKIREIFEKLLLARPRFKEFFIGYPALFALVYLYRRYKKDIILLLAGIPVVVGSVSMVNSFCHVFTEITVSASRTFYGLVLGGVVGVMVILFLSLIIRLYNRLGFADK